MKSHAIIPIFIPHMGCPHACVFCDQRRITANEKPVSESEITGILEERLKTLANRGLTVEAAFYGGSFTGIPLSEQSKYLEITNFYKRRGRIDKIHLSTRPDYIDAKILENLARYGVDVIELGVQSFDDAVLKASKRGHTSAVVYESSEMIQAYGFELGLQLMIGLPLDTVEKAVASAHKLTVINPKLARLYPTVVLKDTELYGMYQRGEYTPLTLEESISITKRMYNIISSAGINIIRVGLKSSELISDAAVKSGGGFHPAFRQLVESDIAKDVIEEQIKNNPDLPRCQGETGGRADGAVCSVQVAVRLASNEKSFSNMIGHQKSNKLYFSKKYPFIKFSYEIESGLADNQYVMIK